MTASTNYAPDPGGNFASDAHRRTACVVANPDQDRTPFDEVVERVEQDEHNNLAPEEVAEILKELEEYGDVDHTAAGWQNTELGFEALTGPIASDGGRRYE